MIVHFPQGRIELESVGINIPLKDNRPLELWNWCLASFKNCPERLKLIEGNFSLTKEDLILAHDQEYVEKLFCSVQSIDCIKKAYELERPDRLLKGDNLLPLSELVKMSLSHAYGTYRAMELAIEHEWAYYLGGGMHHAMSFAGRGFCLVNDIVIAIRKLQKQGKIETAWVIDVDAHKGDGTAEITRQDKTIITASLHMARGWPLDGKVYNDEGKIYPWHLPSDMDVPLSLGEEHLYLDKLSDCLLELEEKFPLPQLCIVVHGADSFIDDALPSSALLKLDLRELYGRDRIIFNFFKERNIPQVYLMAGGYGEKVLKVYQQSIQLFMGQHSLKGAKIGPRGML